MSNLKKHILVADNDPDALVAVQFNLKMAGYQVFTADSPTRAIELLEQKIIHLAVIDMRLTNDQEIEYSGFDVARHVPCHVPFIIYTAFEDTESVKQALVKAGAKESLDKKKPGASMELIETVERLFKSNVRVNFDLDIQGRISCDDIAQSIAINLHGKSQSSVDDVRQILQSLFYDADSIFISPMFSSDMLPASRQSGSLVVLVQPHYKNGWGEARVVKFSEMLEIKQEETNHHRIKPFLRGNRLAVLGDTAYSRQIGGLVYTLIDAEDWEDIQLFSEYFRERDTETICVSLERFFCQTFGALFAGAERKPINITRSYCEGLHLTPQKLMAAMRELRPAEITEPHLRFAGLKGAFLNPVLWVLPGGEFRQFDVVSKECLCHGDLHGRNILINSDGDYWLIDFARVNESHAIRDFVELETDIKFNLMQETDLAVLLVFEDALVTPKRFKDPLPDVPFRFESCRKAYQVIGTLRQVAAKVLSLEGDMSEYYEALLINTLNMLRLRHIRPSKKEHALLAASILCQRLDHWPQWDRAYHPETMLPVEVLPPEQNDKTSPAADGAQDRPGTGTESASTTGPVAPQPLMKMFRAMVGKKSPPSPPSDDADNHGPKSS